MMTAQVSRAGHCQVTWALARARRGRVAACMRCACNSRERRSEPWSTLECRRQELLRRLGISPPLELSGRLGRHTAGCPATLAGPNKPTARAAQVAGDDACGALFKHEAPDIRINLKVTRRIVLGYGLPIDGQALKNDVVEAIVRIQA